MSKEFTIVIAVIAVIFVIILLNQRKDRFTPRRFRVGRDSSMVSSPYISCSHQGDNAYDVCMANPNTKNEFSCQRRASSVEYACNENM